MEQLKQKRANLKGVITRIYTYCSSESATDDGIHVRAEKLNECYNKFEEIQDEIESFEMSSEQATAEQQYREETEEKYFEIKAMVRRFNKNDMSPATMESPSTQLTAAMETMARNQTTLSELVARVTSTPVSTEQIQTTTNEFARLPRIQLPVFDGTSTDWLRFRDIFEATVHNKQNLCNIEKLEYLQCHLKGDALSVIKHIATSNDNYEIAWKLIKDKFNNYDQIKRSYLQLLFDQPAIKNASVIEFRKFVNNINEAVNALQTLNEPVSQWDLVLLFHLDRKLDSESQTLWYRAGYQAKTFANFMDFLSQRVRELEQHQNNKIGLQYTKNKQNVHTTMVTSCACCNQAHPIYACIQFKSLSVNERRKLIQSKQLCYNCLSSGHTAKKCTRSMCKQCKQRHHTLLHMQINNNTTQTIRVDNNSQTTHQHIQNAESVEHAEVHTICQSNQQTVTLLPTSVVLIKGNDQTYHTCRVMLDTGAQVSLISEACTQRLALKRVADNTLLYGVGNQGKACVRGRIHLQIKSRFIDKTITTTALCMHKLTQLMPSVKISNNKLNHFKNLKLSDEMYNVPGPIDVILGAETVSDWLLHDRMVHPSGSPVAINTSFGWCICGSINNYQATQVTVGHVSVNFTDQLQRFWEIEELNDQPIHLSKEEEQAEEHYKKTVKRDENGRYIVRLPFKIKEPEFGNTINQATKRFVNIETKFKHHTDLQTEYSKFIKEYIELGHMEESQPQYVKNYLPHHAVLKPTHTTTKLRVVFDGSAKGSNGTSLNEQLLIGPTIQNDLFTILMQFRKGQIGITADIEKMYRQILIHPDDRAFQGIIWRQNSDQPIATYQLTTVTYGTSAAPFLAIRTLHQVATENADENPKIAEIIKRCFYVDDLICGVADVAEAIEIKNKLCNVLTRAGFHLRKWSSNSQQFLSTINEAELEQATSTVISDMPTVKTLGLYWDINADVFKYSLTIPEITEPISKRVILSLISRIFDPLGWISPVIITLKLFVQKLWITGLDWDTLITDQLLVQWKTFFNNIQEIKEISVPRWLKYNTHIYAELHGFADSSEMAYAAVVYIRVIHDDNSVSTRLLASKTKVAPVNQVTLPRLELCAAQLLTKLIMKTKAALNIDDIKVYAWTDSTIVLAWLSDYPRKWKNFVANRTSFILTHLPSQNWRHISSKQNPADCATRGLTPTELHTNDLWWYGPSILLTDDYTNLQTANNSTNLERKVKVICQVHVEKDNILQRYSDLNTLIRITTWIIRFSKNCQQKYQTMKGSLTSQELEYAHNTLVKLAQSMSFSTEIKILKSGKQLSSNHILSTLTPFLDECDLLRVRGRLENANISYNQMHPFILHKSSKLTELIIRYYHQKFLHAGVRQLQYLIGLKYWIPSLTPMIRRCV